jgi:integrase
MGDMGGELRKRGRIWWLRWYVNGERQEESSGSTSKTVARDLLRRKLGAVAAGEPVTAQIGRFRFEDAAKNLLTEYRVNDRRSIDEADRRIRLHLQPYFSGRRMAGITTDDVRAYIAHRREQGIVATRGKRQGERIGDVSNAEINRGLTLLKRMFTLAVQARKLLHKPWIPLLEERNRRTGFFDLEQLQALMARLPESLRPVVEFAYLTGWRVPSEVLPLEWRQIDFDANAIRLDPETTKNRDGRVFHMTDDLRALLKAQLSKQEEMKKAGHVVPWVFFRLVAKGRGGTKSPKPIKAFTKAWKAACVAAGCPGRIPHDFRRTAVSNMVRRGVPERVAMQLAGHKTRSVFDRYNIVSEGDLRRAAEQLSGQTGTIQGQSGPMSQPARSETIRIAK